MAKKKKSTTISNSTVVVSIDAIDLGVPMLAMHSVRELCGINDVFYLKELAIQFFDKF